MKERIKEFLTFLSYEATSFKIIENDGVRRKKRLMFRGPQTVNGLWHFLALRGLR